MVGPVEVQEMEWMCKSCVLTIRNDDLNIWIIEYLNVWKFKNLKLT